MVSYKSRSHWDFIGDLERNGMIRCGEAPTESGDGALAHDDRFVMTQSRR